jgi:MoaA/NifB/PqqE/SkfB family radical SAM enzyme
MCDIWRYPTKPQEEFSPEMLRKLPDGLGDINITGGEPTLRADLPEIVDVLYPKTKRLEISTNGAFTDRLVEVARRHPDITIRISVEGLPATNDRVRGIPNGFDKALRSYLRLRDVGVKDLGFAVTIQDDNADDLLDLFHLADHLRAEFAQAVPHNSFYFHKYDNEIKDVPRTQTAIAGLIEGLLKSRRPKQWFRAYLNRGLIDHVAGRPRSLACTAGSDLFFVDPAGEVYPCNGMDWSMGNLNEASFDEIWNGPEAEEVRRKVASCGAACWMTGTAVPAMKRSLPRVTLWVLRNKLRLMRGLPVDLGD